MDDCFLIIRDCSTNKKFKVKFRSRDEFFSVTVSKLRRAISSVLDHNVNMTTKNSQQQHQHFSLEFEYAEDNEALGITNYSTTRLPEGQLAEHALIADWGLRPGNQVSLVIPNAITNVQEQHDKPTQLMMFEPIEDDNQEVLGGYDDNDFYKPAANLLIDSSAVSSLAKISVIGDAKHHDEDVIVEHAKHQFTVPTIASAISSSSSSSLLTLSSKQLRDRLKNQQTTFFLSDNLTPAQKELQLKWMRELDGGNLVEEQPKMEQTQPRQHQSDPGLPPVYGISTSSSRSAAHHQPSQQLHRFSPPSSRNDDEVLPVNIDLKKQEKINNDDDFEKLLEYSADRRREALMTLHQQNPQKEKNHSQQPEKEDEIESTEQHYEQQQPLETHDNSPPDEDGRFQSDDIIAVATRDADRRENIKLKEQMRQLSAELEILRDRAAFNVDTVDRKLQQILSSGSNHHQSTRSQSNDDDTQQRRALAEAIINTEMLQKKLTRQQLELEKTKIAVEEERKIRRSMQRDLEMMRGNIRVIVRIRGKQENSSVHHQQDNSSSSIINVNSDRTIISLDRGLLKPRGEFEFYKVLPQQTSQSDFFDLEVAPLIDVCFSSKRNLSLICSGMSGAGKTFCCFGPKSATRSNSATGQHNDQLGVTFRTAAMLLKLVNAANDQLNKQEQEEPAEHRRKGTHHHRFYQVGLSVLELYCDEIRDLLSGVVVIDDHNQKRSMNNDRKNDCDDGDENDHVAENDEFAFAKPSSSSSSSANVVIFRSQDEAFDLITKCASKRWTEATNSNSQSSRSHCLLTFSVFLTSSSTPSSSSSNSMSNKQQSTSSLCTKIVIADLAGSERLNRSGSTGQRLVEAQFINKSLSALGDVVHALTSSNSSSSSSSSAWNDFNNNAGSDSSGTNNYNQIISKAKSRTFVPWRNSSLTQLLQSSMNGDSTTLFIACVVDDEKHVDETHSTLTFASRVRCIKNVHPSNNNNNKQNRTTSSSSRTISPCSGQQQNARSSSSRSSSTTSGPVIMMTKKISNTSFASSMTTNVTAIPLHQHQGGFSRRILTPSGTLFSSSSTSNNNNSNNIASTRTISLVENNNNTRPVVISDSRDEQRDGVLRYQSRKALSTKNENVSSSTSQQQQQKINVPHQHSDPNVLAGEHEEEDEDDLEIIDDYRKSWRTTKPTVHTTTLKMSLEDQKRKIDFDAIQATGHLSASETARLRTLLFKK